MSLFAIVNRLFNSVSVCENSCIVFLKVSGSVVLSGFLDSTVDLRRLSRSETDNSSCRNLSESFGACLTLRKYLKTLIKIVAARSEN
jgi:hypothetical protein